jgi:subfamily B ATP-binding cassette protein MsbA
MKIDLVQQVKGKVSSFLFYYSYIGNKMFIALLISFSVGLMDGLGLAMFIPLLQLVDGKGEYDTNAGSAGNMDIFMSTFDTLGLSLNLVNVLLLILLFFSLKGLFKFLESYFNVVLTMSFTEMVRVEAVDCLNNLNFKYFNQMDSGRIQNSLSTEVDRVRLSYSSYSSAIQSFLTVIVYISLAFLTNPQFAILVIIGGALSNLVYTRLYKRTKEISKKITSIHHSFHGLMMQQVNHFKYLRATGQVSKYSEKLKKIVGEISDGFKKIGFFNAILMATKEPLSIAVVVLVIIVQTTYFSAELGPIILSLLFFYRSLNQVIVFQNHWNTFLNYSGSLSSYKEFIEELKINRLDYSKGLEIKSIDNIEFRDVSFSYNDRIFLKDINIQIPKNKTIAFVGQSGSGKTTLTNILTGLLPIESGTLLVNGNDFNNCNIQQYQARIGYITQEPVIFNDSLFNNVTFWDKKTPETMQRFLDSIHKASLADFYTHLELAENTPLGNNGVMVSGGQKQRIAIARELYKTVDLLVLDEATSALDSATEREIQKYFETLKGDFTFVVIAHRLSTIKNADCIYLLNNGKIEAQGSFLDLQAKSMEFRRMVALQDFKVEASESL